MDRKKIEIAAEKVSILVWLVPIGAKNAIRRDELTRQCVLNGIISDTCRDQDRAMRLILQKARLSHTIIALPTGGYYRPDIDDVDAVRKHKESQERRAKSIFISNRHEGKLLEDMAKGRM